MYDSGHGGNWADYDPSAFKSPPFKTPAVGHPGNSLDFSASVSPLGVPWGIRRAVRRAVRFADRYPDPQCRRLCRAVGAAEGVSPDAVLCGGGAADLIYRAALAVSPRRAVVPVPSFSEYETALHAARCPDVQLFPMGRGCPGNGASSAEDTPKARDFRLDSGFLQTLTPGTDLLFLCQPNNPTGLTIPMPLLRRTLDRCRDLGCRVVLDECFLPFLDRPDAFTAKQFLEQYPSLLILRSFTKLYACAGLRIGYALCADRDFLDAMARSGPPWAVSAPAEAAGLAALGETRYARRVRRLLEGERSRMLAELDALGLEPVPGEANFLLFRSSVPLDAPLLERGIVLRNCGNFHGLDRSWYRAAIRTRRENGRLLDALGEILKGALPPTV